MISNNTYTLPADNSVLSAIELGKMPEILEQMIKRYNLSRDYTTMFDMFRGTRKVATKDILYKHVENQRHYNKLQIAGTGAVGNVVVNGTTVLAAIFTVNASSMSTVNSRNTSPVQYRDMIEIPSTHQKVVVIAVNRTANPHTFAVVSLETGVTPANILAAVAANSYLTNFSSTLSDGGKTGSGILPDYRTYENVIGKIDHAYSYTDGIGMSEQWFKMPTLEGGENKYYFSNVELENYIRFKNKVMYALLFSQRNTANVIDYENPLNNPFMSTKGIITEVRERSQFDYNIGNMVLADFENMTKRLRKKEGAKENIMLHGQGFGLEANRFLVDFYGKCNTYDAFKGGKEGALKFGFKSIDIGGYYMHLQDCPFFFDPDMFGADEQDYDFAALVMPTDSIMVGNSRQESFIIRHTDMRGGAASFYGKDFTSKGGSIDETGFCASWLSDNPSTDVLTRKRNYVANVGVELFGADRFELLTGK